MKACTKCGETKPLEDFYRRAARPDGRTNHCKACSDYYKRKVWTVRNREKNLQAHRARSKRYVERNREKRRETMRLYRLAHREHIKAYGAEYDARKPWVRGQIKHRYWARQHAIKPERIASAALDAKLAEYGGFCAYCQERRHEHWDHVHSLSAGGAHSLANLVPSCAHCNHTKWAHRWPYPDPPVMIPSPA